METNKIMFQRKTNVQSARVNKNVDVELYINDNISNVKLQQEKKQKINI